MAYYTAITHAEHGNQRWHNLTSFYPFLGKQTVPLVEMEFQRACVTFPIAWIESKGDLEPIALLGLQENDNLFVDARHRWKGAYTPAHIRTQPFALVRDKEKQLALGIREDLGLLTEDKGGHWFFDEAGNLTSPLQKTLEVLRKLELNRLATQKATRALDEAGLFRPWEISPSVRGKVQQIMDLYHISPEALAGLDADTLYHLKETGALAMAYCQQISEQLVQRLEKLHALRAKSSIKQSNHPLDHGNFGLGDDEGISFGGMAGNGDEG